MPARPPFRLPLLLAAGALACGLAACGEEAPEAGGPIERVSPARAEAALRAYLDDDRCDLLSDRMLGQIDPDLTVARQRCQDGQLPVDAAVRPGQYAVDDAEVIDEEGLITITLEDGGSRDYRLIPSDGPEGYLVDQVTGDFTTRVGEPLRLQARATPTAPVTDARITVARVKRLGERDLGQDEFYSSLNAYYEVRVRVRSRSEEPIEVGSLGFELAQKDGVGIGTPQASYSDTVGDPLPTVVPPDQTVSGSLFFAVPNESIARPAQVWFSMGTASTGTKLVWLIGDAPETAPVPQAPDLDG